MRFFAKYLVVGCIALVAGFFIGASGHGSLLGIPLNVQNEDVRQVPDGKEHFTSPLLECAELPESISDISLDVAKEKVQALIGQHKKSGDISEASVYFRDLNNGPWFGINEDEKYFPASLLKLPLAMSFYDRAEDEPTLLATEIAYSPDPSVTSQLQPFGGPDKLEAGKKYTVQALLDLMLTESNNEAANTLAVYGGAEMINRVYSALGLSLPKSGEDYFITTHRYASFFRILYNATYVDKTAAEKILKTLSNTSFNDGLVAGVPAGVNVSHKFGTRGVTANNSIVQLHDCGIIYAPKKPYILCVMTQGGDFTKLAAVISDISSIVYTNVTAAGESK